MGNIQLTLYATRFLQDLTLVPPCKTSGVFDVLGHVERQKCRFTGCDQQLHTPCQKDHVVWFERKRAFNLIAANQSMS